MKKENKKAKSERRRFKLTNGMRHLKSQHHMGNVYPHTRKSL